MSRKFSFLFLKYLKFTMPFIYMMLGIVLIFFRDALFQLSGYTRTIFGIALIAYAGLRAYQTFIKERQNEDHD
ncbi:MAG: hypothetical protein ACOYOT_08685 [Bacteroidales bacterium]